MNKIKNISEPNESPLHPWVANEAAGDQQLAQLLIKREQLIDKFATRQTDPDELRADLGIMYSGIVNRKQDLGIPTITPLTLNESPNQPR